MAERIAAFRAALHVGSRVGARVLREPSSRARRDSGEAMELTLTYCDTPALRARGHRGTWRSNATSSGPCSMPRRRRRRSRRRWEAGHDRPGAGAIFDQRGQAPPGPGVRLARDTSREDGSCSGPNPSVLCHGTAAEILALCDGRRSIGEIAASLAERFDADFDDRLVPMSPGFSETWPAARQIARRAVTAQRGLLAELTHRCPLHCEYCSNPPDPPTERGELEQADWSRVMAEAAALGVLQVHFSGGEPLLRPDLPELIAVGPIGGTLHQFDHQWPRPEPGDGRPASRLPGSTMPRSASRPTSRPWPMRSPGVDLASAETRRGNGGRRRRHRANVQHCPPSRQPRPPSRDHRPGRIARCRPDRARSCPVLRLGLAEPSPAHPEPRAGCAGFGDRRRGGRPAPGTDRSHPCACPTTSAIARSLA